MSILKGISSAGEKAIGFLSGAIEQGFGADRAYELLRGTDYEYVRRLVRSDMGLLKGAYGRWGSMKYEPRGQVLHEAYYELTKFPMATNYETKFQIQGYDPETGDSKIIYRTVSHDERITLEELEDDIWNMMWQYQYDIEPEAISAHEAYRTETRLRL